MFCQRKFGGYIRVEPAVALQVLRLQVGEHQRVERHALVPVLQRALAGHLNNRVRASGIYRPAQKRIVLADATFLPLARRISATSSTTVDLPLVPVTAITASLREGKP